MDPKKLFTTGQFARLCKTTKATLFHYDELGLLKPRHVAANGYRRYGLEQFLDFDMISMLKDAGASLGEIKRHKTCPDAEKTVALLLEKRESLRRELVRLTFRERFIGELLAQITHALSCAYDRFEIVEMPEELLEALPSANEAPPSNDGEYIAAYAAYLNHYAEQERYPELPVGLVIDGNGLSQGNYSETAYFSRAGNDTPAEMLHRKPAGRYLVAMHQGDGPSHRAFANTFFAEFARKGLTPTGDCYGYDMASYIICGTTEKCVLKYCMKIDEHP